MKKLIMAILLSLIMILSLGGVALAAPPGEEEWTFADARNGTIRATYFINTTNLFTSSFNIYNENDTYYAKAYVYQNSNLIWSQVVPPNTNWTMEYRVKFFRVPHTDPDDPDSIRYPQGYFFSMWTGENPDNAP